jgi:hypothetical protein
VFCAVLYGVFRLTRVHWHLRCQTDGVAKRCRMNGEENQSAVRRAVESRECRNMFDNGAPSGLVRL